MHVCVCHNIGTVSYWQTLRLFPIPLYHKQGGRNNAFLVAIVSHSLHPRGCCSNDCIGVFWRTEPLSPLTECASIFCFLLFYVRDIAFYYRFSFNAKTCSIFNAYLEVWRMSVFIQTQSQSRHRNVCIAKSSLQVWRHTTLIPTLWRQRIAWST